MGLGKTLSAIALIASDKESPLDLRLEMTSEHVAHTTLVVVRAPCKVSALALPTTRG